MVRLTTISGTISLAVFAAVLPFGRLPALAGDKQADKVETPSQPVEVKAVPVILLPPANDAVFAFKPARPAKAAPAPPEQPTDGAAVFLMRPPPANIQEDATSVELSSLPKPSPQGAPQPPASNAASASPRPATAKIKEDASVELPSLPQQSPQGAPQPPASTAASAPLRPATAKIKEDAASAELPSGPKPSPQGAPQPPASNVASAPLRPATAKLKRDATFVGIPSLPERRPFRPVLYNITPVESAQNAATASQPREPASFMAKVNSAFRPLTNLWPGNRRASETASPPPGAVTASASPDAARDKTGAEAEQGSFLKKLRFW